MYVFPAWIVAVPGTTINGLLEEIATATPPAGAAAVRVTVACTGAPGLATSLAKVNVCRAATPATVSVSVVVTDVPA